MGTIVWLLKIRYSYSSIFLKRNYGNSFPSPQEAQLLWNEAWRRGFKFLNSHICMCAPLHLPQPKKIQKTHQSHLSPGGVTNLTLCCRIDPQLSKTLVKMVGNCGLLFFSSPSPGLPAIVCLMLERHTLWLERCWSLPVAFWACVTRQLSGWLTWI